MHCSIQLGEYMKKIILFLFVLSFSCVYASDDIDFNSRYQKGNWKIDTSKGVNPYNTAGSLQDDYSTWTKYNVQGTRTDIVEGSKVTYKAAATVETTPQKVKDAVKNRLKNFPAHAKDIGKMTVGGFLGSAALTGLIEGIGWVIDEGGDVKRLNEPPSQSLDQPCGECSFSPDRYQIINAENLGYFSSIQSAAMFYAKSRYGEWYANHEVLQIDQELGTFTVRALYTYTGRPDDFRTYNGRVRKTSNPYYSPDVLIPVPHDQVGTALDDAIRKNNETNNPALAAAIAQAIKDVFVDSPLDTDPKTGTKNNPVADETSQALDDAVSEHIDPKVCVPNVGDLDGSCTYMPQSEADKLPSLVCVDRPIISANHCVYQVDPDAPVKPTVSDKPKVNPETGELPEACKWFEIHCKWIDWTQTDDLDSDNELDINNDEQDEPDTELSFSGMCPSDLVAELPYPFNFSFTFSYEPACNLGEMLNPLIRFSALWLAALIIGGVRSE